MIILQDSTNGEWFGYGETHEDAITDAADNAYHGEDNDILCDREWISLRLTEGTLEFVEEET